MAEIDVKISGFSESGGNNATFGAILHTLSEVFGDLSPQIALAMRATYPRIIANEFKKSQDPFGTPWPPIPVPAPWRKIPTQQDKALWDTGHLFGSLVSADAVQVRGPNIVYYGTNVEYAPKHEFGQGVKRRRFMPVSEKNTESLVKEFKAILAYSIENGTLPNIPIPAISTRPPSAGAVSMKKNNKKSAKNDKKPRRKS